MMEYTGYGIYEDEESKCYKNGKPILKKARKPQSTPIADLNNIKNAYKAINGSRGRLSKIYFDIFTVVKFLESIGEILEQKVIL